MLKIHFQSEVSGKIQKADAITRRSIKSGAAETNKTDKVRG